MLTKVVFKEIVKGQSGLVMRGQGVTRGRSTKSETSSLKSDSLEVT